MAAIDVTITAAPDVEIVHAYVTIGTCSDATVQLNGATVGTIASGATDSFAVNLDGSPSGVWDGTAWQVTSTPCADATIELNGVEMTTIPSGDTENISIRQSSGATEVGSKQGVHWRIDDSAISINGSPVADVKAEDSLDIDVTQGGSPVGSWNGSAWIVPPCVDSSISIGVFSDAGHTTPITVAPFGATIYLKATATDFTPEGYIFYAVDANGTIFAIGVEQVGDSTTWMISATGDIQIGCIASPHAPIESERRWYGESQDFEVSADSDAVAFIAAHETETGLTMDTLQKSVIDTFYLKFKGAGTTNGSDLWTLATSSAAVLFGYIPTSNSVATASGFKIDIFNPSNFCTFAGFISGDFLPSGLTGGSGKYSRLTVSPSDFGQNDISLAVFSKTDVASTNKAIGSKNATSEASIIKKHSSLSGKSVVRINHTPTAYAYTGLSVDGDSNLLATRKISSAIEYSVDGVAQPLTDNGSQTSVTPNTQEIYAHAFNSNGSPASYDSGTFTGFAVMPSMTVTEKADFQECIDYLNANIITGGR